jgi:D,D-heptose 1,7-bisphosphate phosphatase
MNKAVFLDRDGVINVDYGYVHRVEDFKFLPGAIQALRILAKEDYKLVVVTNQSGIGMGHYTLQDAEAVHLFMCNELEKAGVVLDGVYLCPHSPESGCGCRKPSPLLVSNAAAVHNIDLSRSFFVGDKTRDVQTGKNSGCRTIMVMTGKAGSDNDFDAKPDYTAKDLLDAVRYIVDEG